MRDRVRIGLIAIALTGAITGRGCITTPLPVRSSLTSGDTATPATAAPPPAPADPQRPVQATETPDERRAALDKQLSDSLGAFDARLQKEQQKTSEERDARQATVAAATASADGSDAAPGAGGQAPAEEVPGAHGGKQSKRGGESKAGHAGDLKSDEAAGAAGSASGNGAPAVIVPDGSDDDIVARRIRKAAEQETDPELKDKLWKEYVEYKKNTPVR